MVSRVYLKYMREVVQVNPEGEAREGYLYDFSRVFQGTH